MKQRLVKVDGKVRTDETYPAGFMGQSNLLRDFTQTHTDTFPRRDQHRAFRRTLPSPLRR